MDRDGGLRPPPRFLYEPTVRRALEEDLGWGDVTSETFVPDDAEGRGTVVARQDGVVAGIGVAGCVFETVDPGLRVIAAAADGDTVRAGSELLTVEGSLRSILAAERVALNFLQRLSGIATLTARYVAAVDGTGVRIVDSRKTTPGLRLLEKYAVRCGGGVNHRWSLGDAVLVKDNHVAALASGGTSLADAIRTARTRLPHVTAVQVEVDTLEQLEDALAGAPDAILLDNMSPATLREAVARAAGRVTLEASGGITLETVRAVAETGVDLISVGALTHSPASFDAALDLL